MAGRIILFSLLLSCLFPAMVNAQQLPIIGEVLDIDNQQGLGNVRIENIYNNMVVNTDKDGRFLINADKGQLLEFRKEGYKTVRVRIPAGEIPSYFKIILEKGFTELPLYAAHDWKSDSMRDRALYQHELDFPKLNTLETIEHPFSALSSHNREIWDFQDQYAYYEKQKYIDHVFTKELVTKLTGLQGDSLTSYMRRFRPGYEQLRQMNEYNFYTYIRRTVQYYRQGSTSRFSH